MKVFDDVEKTKHFCILPWIHFHAWPDKRVMPCCMADSQKPVSSTDKNSVLDIMNSDEYKEMRLKMLNDEKMDICSRCYSFEDYGIWSMRQSHNRNRTAELDQLLANTNEDGSISDFKLKYLDIRFSNICNFKCRSCGPACSSRWAEEHVQIHGKKSLKQYFNINKIVTSNNEKNNLLNKLQPYLLDVEEVYFAGGEALITEEHYDILDYWLENNHTDNIITYTTNFSTLRYKNKNVIDYWKQFKNVQVWASLDGYGELLEIMRHGAEWEVIQKNIELVKQEVPHVKFGITPTISIYNVFQFPIFHRFLLDKGWIDISGLRLNILTGPWYMGLDVLPPEIANNVKNIWWSHYEWLTKQYPDSEEFLGQIRTVCTALKNSKGNHGGVKQFFERNDELDVHRKEDLLNTVPELRELHTWMIENS